MVASTSSPGYTDQLSHFIGFFHVESNYQCPLFLLEDNDLYTNFTYQRCSINPGFGDKN